MQICVISGSPKGKNSITFQTVLYLQKQFPEDTFETIHVGPRIRALEKDMAPALAAVKKAELLLFCYPVYTFLVPYQLHRFVELLKESGADLGGKYAAQLSTSKHFYDVTAHTFIQENCVDLNLAYLGGLSADMDDLLTEQGRADASAFWKLVHFRVENGISLPSTAAAPRAVPEYVSSISPVPKHPGREVVIVANLQPGDTSLAAMIQDFRDCYPHQSKVVNLNDYPFSGGCLGCFHCAVSGKCVYTDGFDEFLRQQIQTNAAIVYAFRIQDHSMGSRMKLYDDRQFCNGHRTVTEGMPFGYIVNGDYGAEANLRTIVEARAEVGHNFLAGVGYNAQTLTAMINRLAYAMEHKYVQPRNFWGVGGMKIFRDLIWIMRGLMKADHDFYKKHGVYDFPQKQRGRMLVMCFLGAMVRNPRIKAKMGNKMNESMAAPYVKVINSAQPKKR